MAERLQKVLARAGLGSRREIESWIRAGRITVNGRPAELGISITERDRIRIDGRPVSFSTDPQRDIRTLIYHKPAGELTTRKDAADRPTVFDSLPRLRHARWISIGRLDMNTAGLLLVTTDGELAHRLMHPSYEIEREYAVRVLGEITPENLRQLQTGVMLDDGMAHFDRILDSGGEGRNHWYRVIVKEGRNRLVRRMFEALGYQVSRLMRVRLGIVSLPASLRRGNWVELKESEIRNLLDWVGSVPPVVLPYREPARKSPAANKKTKSPPARVSSQTKGKSG